MTIKDEQDGKFITLSKAFDNRAKILNICYFAVFSLAAALFLAMAISDSTLGAGLIIFIVIVLGVFLIVGFRFINKALQTETLFVNKKILIITRTGFFTRQQFTYDIAGISKFRHLEKPPITRHPLAGQTTDYLGFQTEQQMINEVHGDNRLAFDYDGKTIKFGENMYSWDFEQLEILLYEITGNDFRYTDEFEKTFNTEN